MSPDGRVAEAIVEGGLHLVVRDEDRDAVVELLAALLVAASEQQDDLDGPVRKDAG